MSSIDLSKRKQHEELKTRLLADTIEHVPEVAHLHDVQLGNSKIPAFLLTSKTMKNMTSLFSADSEWNGRDVRSLVKTQRTLLREQLAELLDQIDELKNRARTDEDNAELEALKIRRRKKIDEWRINRALDTTFGDEQYWAPAAALENDLSKKLIRAGLLPPRGGPAVKSDLDALMRSTLVAQKELSWDTDTDQRPPSTESADSDLEGGSAPEIIERNFAVARQRVCKTNADLDGRMHGRYPRQVADVEKARGFTPAAPSTILDQYGIVKQSQAMMNSALARKTYRKYKRQLREKGIHINRVLNSDTEYSWDVNEDGDGEEPSAQALDFSQEKSLKWIQALPDQPNPAEMRRRSPVPTLPSVCSMGLFDGYRDNDYYQDRRLAKRLDMWPQIERKRTRELFEGRARAKSKPKRRRILHQQYNAFMSQMPEHFPEQYNMPC
jgi:hypothetical protein